MKDSIQIIRSGILTTAQGLGRVGQGSLGVSISGAFDREPAAAANGMVANGESLAVLGCVVGGLEFQIAEEVIIPSAGVYGEVIIRQDGKVIKTSMNSRIVVGVKATVRFGTFDAGLRGHVAIREGTDVAEVLGSWLYDTLGKLDPAPLQAGQVLQAGGPEYSVGSSIAIYPAPHWSNETARLDVVPGPRADWFTPESVSDLLHKTWTMTQEVSHVGLRLNGTTLECQVTHELASEGMVPGTIQVPASGQPIIFGPDYPATGGYPVIGVLTEPSLSKAGQLMPGAKV